MASDAAPEDTGARRPDREVLVMQPGMSNMQPTPGYRGDEERLDGSPPKDLPPNQIKPNWLTRLLSKLRAPRRN
jgi:hypothetical protein